MAVTPDILADPEAVPLGLLRRYLAANGWRRATLSTRDLNLQAQSVIARAILDGRTGGGRSFDQFVLSEEGSDDVEIILPRELSSPDYRRQIRGAIRTLSNLEGRDPQQVINAVRLVGFDVVRSRIPDALVFDDAIHLEVASNYITGVRHVLAATATTEIQPDPYFLRVKKEATQYADTCRFGHTFRGSFGFTVESPVIPNVDPPMPFIEQTRPFERRVIERLVRGVKALCDAVDLDDPAHLVEAAPRGFSANACEKFVDLIDETAPGGMAFSFALSPEWQTPADIVEIPEYVVGPRHVEIMRTAAKALRLKPVPRPETVIGLVIELASEADPSDLLHLGDREIVVKWFSSTELGEINVHISLNGPDYLLALEAHRAGRPVVVSGTLEKRGRPWVLSNPSGFSVA